MILDFASPNPASGALIVGAAIANTWVVFLFMGSASVFEKAAEADQ
jgi:hypothetical protein